MIGGSAGTQPAQGDTALRVANAPCSWGVLEFEATAGGAAAPCDVVLREMVEAGFVASELGDWGFLPTDAAALRDKLAEHGMQLVGGFVPAALADAARHDEALGRALRTARLMASAAQRPLLILADDNGAVPERVRDAGRIRPEQGLSPDQWRTFADGAQRIARAVQDAVGVRTVFHHHCGGYVETPEEVERLLELTEPATLGLCLDAGHYAFGGGDPLEAVRRYGERIWHVHFKDCDPRLAARARAELWGYFRSVREGVFCELGCGMVDFPALRAGLDAAGYNGWVVVEQDVLPGMGTPLESARRNRAYLAGLGL